MRAILIWAGAAAVILVPVVLAAMSPLLAWRDPVYQIAGFAGVIGMALLLVQPLLAAGVLPGLGGIHGRRLHRAIGAALVATILLHVAALWITSPPDVIDALTFMSPTKFSAWGVVSMWAIFATAALAGMRRRLRVRVWRRAHTSLAVVIVSCSVVHAVLIEGTMETVSKAVLCAVVAAATLKVVVDTWRRS